MSDYIPQELLDDILVRLPAKSLLRFTAVCKSWYSLITNPTFIISHRNRTNSQTLLVRDYDNTHKKERYTLRRDDDTFGEPYLEFEFPFETAIGFFRIVGSCCGMLCLTDDLFGLMKSAVLWNPSIRKSVVIQMPDKPQLPHFIVLGFGVCPVSNDTKIVRIVYLKKVWHDHDHAGPLEVQIYSLATGEWRNVTSKAPPYCMLEFIWSQVFLNGIVHWIAYDEVAEHRLPSLVVSFDLSEETFDEIMLPVELRGVDARRLLISVIGESLAVFHWNTETQSCCIWVMKEYKIFESWTKLFSIDISGLSDKKIRFRKNGEVLLVTKNNEVVSYNPDTYQTRDFGIVKGVRSFCVGYYTETLFLLKGENANAEEAGAESST
jgi:F-box interacting protein